MMRCTCGREVVVVAVVVVVVLDNGRMDLAKRRSMAETVVENVQCTAAVFRLFGSCTCRVQDRWLYMMIHDVRQHNSFHLCAYLPAATRQGRYRIITQYGAGATD